jgi:hypothetical protein
VTTCVALDPDCERCQRNRRDHDGHPCDDLCSLFADLLTEPGGHEALHQAEFCRSCGADRRDTDGMPTDVTRPCAYGNCRNWYCASCDVFVGSDGPVGCRCNSGWPTRLLLRWWAWLDRRRANRTGGVR